MFLWDVFVLPNVFVWKHTFDDILRYFWWQDVQQIYVLGVSSFEPVSLSGVPELSAFGLGGFLINILMLC